MSEFTLEIQSFIDPIELGKSVSINAADLDSAIIEHSALVARFGAQAVQAREQYDRVKAVAEVMESKLFLHHRQELLKAGKATEAVIEATVKSDPRWVKIQHKVIQARAQHDLATNAVEALKQRHGMLIQLGALNRMEREGEIRMGAAKSVTKELQQAVLEHLKQRGA